MSGRREFCIGAVGTIAFAQERLEKPEKPIEFLCPMDADVRQSKPGRCPRCGMKLVAGLPDPIEYPVAVTMVPPQPKPGQKVRLRFSISDPKTAKPVTEFDLIHERVLHLFLISDDLQQFAHEHPEAVGPGVFEIDWTFVRGGMWRVLLDFYPTHATPQLISRSILLGGAELRVPELQSDSGQLRKGANVEVSLRLDPEVPLAGEKTLLQYRIVPREKFEPFLGAMGHMLVASADLIDLIHTHPFLVDGGLAVPPVDAKQVQFNVIFPRPGMYRVWAQFQRAGVVNTIPFNVEVKNL